MASKKTHDLSVKVGTYLKDGAEKGRYKTCGMILTKDDGGEMIMIDPLFNFAAVQRDTGRDYVILSKFEVKENKSAGAPQFDE